MTLYARNPFRRDFCLGQVTINPENAGHGMAGELNSCIFPCQNVVTTFSDRSYDSKLPMPPFLVLGTHSVYLALVMEKREEEERRRDERGDSGVTYRPYFFSCLTFCNRARNGESSAACDGWTADAREADTQGRLTYFRSSPLSPPPKTSLLSIIRASCYRSGLCAYASESTA